MTITETLQNSTFNVDETLQQAVTCHKSGNLEKAELLYRAILNVVPQNPDANHNLGVLAVQLQQPLVALPHFSVALESNPNQQQYWLSYIDALIQTNQPELARQSLLQGRVRGLSGEAVGALVMRLDSMASTIPIAAHTSTGADGPYRKQKRAAKKREKAINKGGNRRNMPGPAVSHAVAEPISEEIELLMTLFNQSRYLETETLAQEITERFPQHGFGWKALGVLLKLQGRTEESLVPMQKAVALLPEDAEAFCNLVVTLNDLGRLEEAEENCRRALEIKPDYAEAHCNLGNTLRDLGRLSEAETCYRRALEIKPDFVDSHNNLGNTLRELGRLVEAEASYRRVLELKPDLVGAYSNLGAALNDQGRLEEAEACCRRALEIKPDYAEAHNNLGNTLREFGRLSEAEACYRSALEINYNLAEAHSNLGNTFSDLGRPAEAVASYLSALEIKPDYIDAHNNLGISLKYLGRFVEAEASFRRALEINQGDTEAFNNLGVILRDLDRLAEAEASYRRALELKPDYAEAHSNLGNTLTDLGQLIEAEASYRRALESKPDYAEAHSNLLFALNHSASHPPLYILEEARRYGQMVAKKVKGVPFSAWHCTPRPVRLRVGLVSGDLRNHPVGYFLDDVLTHIDQSRLELLAYTTDYKADELTARIKPYFSEWKSLFGLKDEAAARLIHADGVHLLLDLSGHTAKTRLPVLVWKPAPVQVSWLGYFATTGVAEMDYLLADEVGVPKEQQEQFTETIWYLPDTRLCFSPPDVDLDVTALPALKSGVFTFGSFQNLSKVGDVVLAVWGKIMNALPKARLRLQCKQLGNPAVVEQLVQRLHHHGIDPARVSFFGYVQRQDYFDVHAEVDLILDTFPYPGGTTTCEALWMGVPTLSLAGCSLLSRQGASLLTAAGLSEFVAENETDYIKKAIDIASDLTKLAVLRAGLRHQVLASPLFDAPRFARHFEAAMWGIWGMWEKNREHH